jgi:hypothetical protein
MVIGPDPSYLWILAREPRMANDMRERLLAQASATGVNTPELIGVDHSERRAGATKRKCPVLRTLSLNVAASGPQSTQPKETP